MESRPKVLVVDDDEQILSLLDTVLKSKGFDCEWAFSAQEAKQKIARQPIDLVLCDILMPDESGIELCRQIRKENPVTAVLMVTGLKDPKTIDQAIKAGADGYITKPIEPSRLLPQITAAICHRNHEILAERYREELEKTVQEKTRSLERIISKLSENEKRFTAIAESAQDAIVMVDHNGRILFWNKRAEDMFGYPKGEVMGQDLHELLAPPEYKTLFKEAFPKFRQTGKGKAIGRTLELTAVRKDGTEFPIELSLSSIEVNGKWGAVGIIRDITERKLMIEALRDSEEQFRVAIENSSDGIALIRGTQHFYVNSKYLEILGYNSPDELIGQPISKVIHRDDRERIYQFNEARHNGGPAPSRYEAKLVRKDGTTIHVEISATLTKYRDKPLILANIRDISERKQMEEQLSKSEQFLNDMFNAIQDGISVLDTDLTVKKVNSRMEDWYSANVPLVGKKCYEVYYNRKSPCKRCPTLRAIKTGKTEREIAPGLPGSPVEWVELFSYPIFDNTGHVTGVVEFVRDITEFKRAEDSLRKREQLYRSLVESTTDAIVHLDKERKIVSCNRAFLDIFGYEKEEVVGKSILLAHESNESFRAFGQQAYSAIAKKGFAKTEWTFVTKDGRKIPFEITTSAIKDPSGKITGYVSIMRDITERRMAEQALRESEEKYRVVVENLKEGIVVGQEGKLKFVNPAITKITGYSEKELLSMPWINIIHPDDKQIAITNHMRRLEGKEVPETYLMRIIDKEGKTHWLENSGVVIRWENKPAILNFLTDVTERKLAEDEFRRAHHELEDLIKSISSILIELTPEHVVRRWNRVAENVFGIDAGSATGRRLQEIDLSWDLVKVIEGLEQCKNTKDVVRLQDVPFVQSSGNRGFLGITITPKLDDKNELKGFIIMASDITERRNLETQLLQAQKLESVGQLAAGIAHEINTPTQFVGDNIQFLQGSLEDLANLLKIYRSLADSVNSHKDNQRQLAEKAKEMEEEIDLDYLTEEIPKAIEQSMEGIKRVARIVRAMKEFSHPGSDEKTLIDLNHAIENTITVAKNEWKYVADMETNLDPSLPPVPCLPGELNQVILNMIINAAHAISEVVGKDGGKGKITITTQKKDDWVEIRIADTGTGIPEDIRDRIFDPFFTTKEVGKGTGQGLAISRSVIVDKHGGSIDVETEVGKGTTFIIKLPLAEST